MKWIALLLSVTAGCAAEESDTGIIASNAAPLSAAPVCARWSDARPFRAMPMIATWYGVECPVGMDLVLCDDGDIMPDNCVWFDGQPYGLNPACCPIGDAAPLWCKTTAACPDAPSVCYDPWCNTQTGQCVLTGAFNVGGTCGNAGVCRYAGMYRSSVDGLLISEPGWPAVCDVPQWPE